MPYETVNRPGEGWRYISVSEDCYVYLLQVYVDDDVLPKMACKMTHDQFAELRDKMTKVLDEREE